MGITSQDVQAAALGLVRAMGRLGMIPEEAVPVVSQGNQLNGITYGLNWRASDEPGRGHRCLTVDFQGAYTAREAFARISGALTALNAVEVHLRDNPGPAATLARAFLGDEDGTSDIGEPTTSPLPPAGGISATTGLRPAWGKARDARFTEGRD